MSVNVALRRGAKGLGVRVSKEVAGMATTVVMSAGAVWACVADMDVIMYLCAVAGLAGAMSLDKKGVEI